MIPIDVTNLVAGLPAVSKADAMKAALQLATMPAEDANPRLCEILGCATTIDDPERLRSFIVWQAAHGPILKDSTTVSIVPRNWLSSR